MREGQSDVLWTGRVKWMARSSGTSCGRSKYIPVTTDGLVRNHMRGMRDVVVMASHIYPELELFAGRTLTLGGSHELEGETVRVGDLSAILIEHTPRAAAMFRKPSREVALMADFEQKIEALCGECVGMNITSIAGVPSWNLVMLKRVLEYTGKSNICEVWPELQLFVHGGVNFEPYREEFERIIPSKRMRYMQTYNASEGFFAMADRADADDMLLMLDYGAFYEFVPVLMLNAADGAIPLCDVQVGVEYAVVVTNCNGLWRYMIGDTVEFTSTAPYRVRVTGRVQSFINAFGEELVVSNADRAVAHACRATGAEVEEYTAAPLYMDKWHSRGAHQWLVEFRRAPQSVARFVEELDIELCRLNSDYSAKRSGDLTLRRPEMVILPEGSFVRWMAAQGRLGGQNKVPRLRNDRSVADSLLGMVMKI